MSPYAVTPRCRWTTALQPTIPQLTRSALHRYHYGSHDELRGHLALFLDAHNYARRLKTLKGLTPHELPGPNI